MRTLSNFNFSLNSTYFIFEIWNLTEKANSNHKVMELKNVQWLFSIWLTLLFYFSFFLISPPQNYDFIIIVVIIF